MSSQHQIQNEIMEREINDYRIDQKLGNIPKTEFSPRRSNESPKDLNTRKNHHAIQYQDDNEFNASRAELEDMLEAKQHTKREKSINKIRNDLNRSNAEIED